MSGHSPTRIIVMLVLAILTCMPAAHAYPDKPITYIVPSSPGSSPDIIGRVTAEALSSILGKPVVVLNRPGAGGTVAAAAAARAAPDGYTILQANTNHSFSQTLYKNLSYDLEKDFVPVTRFASAFYVVLAHPQLGVRTIKDLIDKAKAQPGKLNYATGGVGSATFIVAEVLKAQAGLDMVHIPFGGGGPALNAILSGVTDIYGSPYTTAKPFIDDWKLVGLAVSSSARIPYMPELPTVAETLPGYEVTTWYGLLLPQGTPSSIRDTLHAATMKAMNVPQTRKRLEELGYVTMQDTSAAFGAFIRDDIEKMARLIKQYNLKAE